MCRLLISSFLFALVIQSCSSDSLKKQQFISQGKLVYQKQCIHCHQGDGNGYEKLYPPINQADFFTKDPLQSICHIVNGLEGEILVNGETYNMPMPKFNHLTNDELAKLLTYLDNAWQNKGKLYSAKEIEAFRNENCGN